MSVSHSENGSADSSARVGASGRAIVLIVGAVALTVFVIDQLAKQWAENDLTLAQPVSVLGSLLQLRLIYNSGAAFGLGSSATVIITVIQIAISVAIVVAALTVIRNRWWALSLGLLLGGALGNVYDRLFRPPGAFRGEVVDFLELPYWPIFNAADIAVTSGAILLILLTFLNVPSSRPRESEDVTRQEAR